MDKNGSLWLPPANSTFAEDVDGLFYFILDWSIIIQVIVTLLILWFIIAYRRKGKEVTTSPKDHNLLLEIIWTAVPTVLVMIVFFWGFTGYMKMRVMPANALEIKVTAQKWFWSFAYPDGNSSDVLVVPVNQPVRLLMSSQDVLHSFFVPNFRAKMDVLPNRYTSMWFQATDTGTFDIYCTEYCGQKHSEMIAKVIVLEQDQYLKKLDEMNKIPDGMAPADYGRILYQRKACITCHSLDGSIIQGPSFKGSFGTTISIAAGGTVLMDENYIRESILNPKAKIHAGFQPVMPTYQGMLKDPQIDALVAFIKSLNQPDGAPQGN